MKTKNQGQVLLLFILIIPIIFLLFALIIDVGLSYTEKRKLDHNTQEIIQYGLKNKKEPDLKNKMADLLKENIKTIDELTIHIEENKIRVNVTTHRDSIFSDITGKKQYQITSKYQGTIQNDQMIIKKE